FDSLIAVKEQLRAIPGKGLRYGSLVGYERPLPRICVNYLGQFESNSAPAWQLSHEQRGQWSHPTNTLPYAINLVAMIIDGRLQIRLSSRVGREDTQRLAQALEANLITLIERSARTARTYLTASDTDHLLSQDHLNRLQDDRELEAV